ncbi:MAG TPA: ABC transporter permease [Casimicrobiaceae bacterium]|nr:ABC transporter permease [Casimicrobiaceae bacterium]
MTTTLYGPLGSFWRNRRLIGQLAKRDVIGRYRGSILGILWALFNPLFLLAAYTFVFSSVFKMRWGPDTQSTSQFAIIVFAGMIVHGFFAECAARAPGLVVGNPSYVKRVVFPLEVLPWVAVLAALFHTAVSLLVLFAFIAFDARSLPWTVLLAPVVLLPLAILTVGVCWFLAAIGVFLRDVGQTVGLVVTLLLFLAPVFYPIQAVPVEYRGLIYLNFLTFIIDQLRAVVIAGSQPDWTGLLIYAAFSLGAAWLGLTWFQRSRRGFADVL